MHCFISMLEQFSHKTPLVVTCSGGVYPQKLLELEEMKDEMDDVHIATDSEKNRRLRRARWKVLRVFNY